MIPPLRIPLCLLYHFLNHSRATKQCCFNVFGSSLSLLEYPKISLSLSSKCIIPLNVNRIRLQLFKLKPYSNHFSDLMMATYTTATCATTSSLIRTIKRIFSGFPSVFIQYCMASTVCGFRWTYIARNLCRNSSIC